MSTTKETTAPFGSYEEWPLRNSRLARYFMTNGAADAFERKLSEEKKPGLSFEQRILQNLRQKTKKKSKKREAEEMVSVSSPKPDEGPVSVKAEGKIQSESKRTKSAVRKSSFQLAKEDARHAHEDCLRAMEQPQPTRDATTSNTTPSQGGRRRARRRVVPATGALRCSDVSWGDLEDALARAARLSANLQWEDLGDELAGAQRLSLAAPEPLEASWGDLADVLEQAKRDSSVTRVGTAF